MPCFHMKSNREKRFLVLILLPVIGGLFLLFLVIGIFWAIRGKKRSIKNEPKEPNENLFSIWSFDGKIVYENIVEATKDFSSKHCIGVGGYGIVYKAKLPSGQVVAVKKLDASEDDEREKLKESEYEAHITNFGTARVLWPDSSNWTSFAGTFGYAAPELAYTMKLRVLPMEVIMGKHPGELISSLLPSWSSSSASTAHGILLKGLLDQHISPPRKQAAEEVVSLVKLAFACLHPSPQFRPTMQQVSVMLSKQRPALQNSSEMITLAQLLDIKSSTFLPSVTKSC
ncbi:unnamed protein product [Ilex paraguariensis]|uniref:non-specific serine/threonine protein kinase n=1 Tax=Ilex paraguariensis TaxID=185542 RepID=A0ABC8QPU0_9AQUA